MFSNHGMKLEINDKRKNGKFTNIWRLNNMPLKQRINEEIKREIKKHLEKNENGSTTHQNLWSVAKPNPRGKFLHAC